MKEIKAIVDAYDKLDKATANAALATVVRVEGSSYRRTGARMLVMDDGVWVGGISGGCLEGDALRRARLAITKSESSLITYNTIDDDEHQIGIGLGCNGIIDVLFTPLRFDDKNNPVEILKTCIAQNRQTHILLTVTGLSQALPSAVKTGAVIRYTGPHSLDIFRNISLQDALNKKIAVQVLNGKSSPAVIELENGEKLDVFIEILPPEIHLVLMGHQYDVYPLCRLTKEMGWRATVVANPLKVNPKIAAIADAVVGYEKWDTVVTDSHTAVILMSHDYKTDKYNLPNVLNTGAAYIGMLGPRVRSEKIWRELGEENQAISPENMQRIYAPVGLDIGAVSPEEIALSLIAEIRASFSQRNGANLRLRQTTIHERS